MNRILIALQSPDMADAVEDLLEDLLDGEDALSFAQARNCAKVWSSLDMEARRMLITELDLAEDKASGVVRQGGLRLARQVRERYPDMPLVLISPYTTTEISQSVEAIGKAALVLQGRDFEDDLVTQVCHGLGVAAPRDDKLVEQDATKRHVVEPPGTQPVAAEAVRYLVEIRLREGGECDYHSRSIGGLVPYINESKFTVKPEDLQELVALTAKLADSKNWTRDYKLLGEKLREVLLEGDKQVMKNLANISGRMSVAMADGAESSPAICFIVEKGLYPIALEAIRGGDGSTHYWLERAPVWRRLAINGARKFPLFRDPETRDKPINCLLVEADTSGMVKPLNLKVDPIPAVSPEAQSLIDCLNSQTTVRIGKIGRIWCSGGRVFKSVSTREALDEDRVPVPCEGSFRNAMRDMLTTGEPWHLVHYAGHSHYDPENDYGYVVLPGKSLEVLHEPDYVGTIEFAKWLNRTHFVYMSSCEGSAQDFAFNLCQHGVPALTGFRWVVKDDMAKLHSETFYEELFRCRSIEEALYFTWNHMYGCHPMDRVWASSQLVMQYAA